MTLILGLLTHDYVIQISDRRVTSWPSCNLIDDERNKAIQFNNNLVLSCTGLAEISGMPTAEWVVKVGAKLTTSLDEFIKTIQTEATTAFSSLRIQQNLKRHLFTGIGFAQTTNFEQIVPIHVVISNAWDSANKTWLDEAKNEFEVSGYILPPKGRFLFIHSMGANLIPQEVTQTKRLLRKAFGKVSPLGLASILCDTIWQVASRNKTVGKSLMVNILPKLSVESSVVGMVGLHPDTKEINFPTFLNIHDDFNNKISYFPYFVGSGLKILGGYIERT